MNKTKFNSLHIDDRARIVIESGEWVETIACPEHLHHLYSVDSDFVEVICELKTCYLLNIVLLSYEDLDVMWTRQIILKPI